MQVPYTISSSAITVVLDGQVIVVPSSSGSFEAIKEELKKPVHDVEALSILADKTKAVEAYAKGKVNICDGVVFYEGEAVHNTLTEKLLSLMDEGFQIDGWVKFLENLMENPSYRSRNCLYNFLEKFQAPFTEDGCFIAFKRVRSGYKDIRSGKFDNSPGQVVVMDRVNVDDDPNNTCSSGLHVAADSYLDSYANTYNSKTVMVKVNPRDVVAVPADYNFAKMRVCRYEVLSEVAPDKIKEAADTTYVRSLPESVPLKIGNQVLWQGEVYTITDLDLGICQLDNSFWVSDYELGHF